LCAVTLIINSALISGQISFAVIAHNTEQHCVFGSTLSPEESYLIPTLETTGLMHTQ